MSSTYETDPWYWPPCWEENEHPTYEECPRCIRPDNVTESKGHL